jgi:hypothetical protein
VSGETLWPIQAHIHSLPGFFPWEIKWLKCEADLRSPSSAKVKNAWSYTFTPSYVCMALGLDKHQEQLYLYLLGYRKAKKEKEVQK